MFALVRYAHLVSVHLQACKSGRAKNSPLFLKCLISDMPKLFRDIPAEISIRTKRARPDKCINPPVTYSKSSRETSEIGQLDRALTLRATVLGFDLGRKEPDRGTLKRRLIRAGRQTRTQIWPPHKTFAASPAARRKFARVR